MLIYFPRWFFQQNLGDSLVFTFIPKLLKKLYPRDPLTVVTYGDLINVLKHDKNVDNVRLPTIDEIRTPQEWWNFTLSLTQYNSIAPHPVDICSIYPDWHPKVWTKWNQDFDYLTNHPTVNLISFNYLCQLGLSHLAFRESYDFTPEVNCIKKPKIRAIGIVPDTKLSNRPNPHPGCDGIGHRFNGPKGEESWQQLVDYIRSKTNHLIVEFSRENMGLGDIHYSELPMLELASVISSLDMGILSDGGMHHVFTSQRIPTVLLGAQKINKPEFFKLGTDYHPKHLEKCGCSITNLQGWPDLKYCNLACETMDPIEIAKYTLEKLNVKV
jgi:hypothetical protein